MNKPTRPEVTGRRAGSSGDSPDDPICGPLRTFCRKFGLSRTRVYQLRKAGVFTRKIVGGRSLWIFAEGQAYLDSLPTGERPRPAPGRQRRSPGGETVVVRAGEQGTEAENLRLTVPAAKKKVDRRA